MSSAFLCPSSGGDAIPLNRTRLYLGRSREADPAAPTNRDTALVLLELVEGWWWVEDLRSPVGVRINGVACKKQKLAPNDEIEIGRHAYRIHYETPKYLFGRSSGGEFQTSAKRSNPSTAAPRPTAPTGPHGRLVPLGGGPDFALSQPRITVGRRAPCQMVIERSTVSSRHCELEFVDGYWFVRDLDSRNGIRIDGQRCQDGWVLPGGRLTIGDQRFQIEYTASGPPPLGATAVRLEKSLMEQAGLDDRRLHDLPRDDDTQPMAERRRWSLTDQD